MELQGGQPSWLTGSEARLDTILSPINHLTQETKSRKARSALWGTNCFLYTRQASLTCQTSLVPALADDDRTHCQSAWKSANFMQLKCRNSLFHRCSYLTCYSSRGKNFPLSCLVSHEPTHFFLLSSLTFLLPQFSLFAWSNIFLKPQKWSFHSPFPSESQRSQKDNVLTGSSGVTK